MYSLGVLQEYRMVLPLVSLEVWQQYKIRCCVEIACWTVHEILIGLDMTEVSRRAC